MDPLRSPLERDHRLVLDSDHAQIVEHLTSPTAVTAWFNRVERHELGGGEVVWSLTGTRLQVRGQESTGCPYPPGLLLDASREEVLVFLAVRRIIVAEPVRCATEIRLHIETPNTCRGRRLVQAFPQTATAGLAHMHAELGR